ncbi:holin [Microbacterium sp. LWH11-1.2]|uniref:holin n=1 Tax=Microbacterium sp. LWH11-1.2 TaxID=3135258 RepID=UPI003139CB75
MSKYADKQFWIDLFDRAIATAAQSLAGVLAVDKIGLLDVDWYGALGVAGAITLASVLTSIAFRGNTPKSEV